VSSVHLLAWAPRYLGTAKPGQVQATAKLAQEYFHDVLAGQDADSFGSLVDHLKSTAGDAPHSSAATAMSALEHE
jgi:hypothetical protein